MIAINEDLPEQYKYETGYRKIPREYLNSNIPKGRGSVKWQPFASILNRMFNDPHINIRYFRNGYIKSIEGYIRKVDTYTQTLHLYVNKGITKLDLKDIVEIK